MLCFYCRRETGHFEDMTHEEKRRELESIKTLPAFANHDLVNDIKIKRLIHRIRQDYCPSCTRDQLAYMSREHVERLLARTEL